MDMIKTKTYSDTIIERIARIAHEANRAYCEDTGDNSQDEWGKAYDWQKQSAIGGVRFKLDNEDATPADQHEAWCEAKRADGWKHGPVKDIEKKEHPCMVAYSELPSTQRAKDFLFVGIVKAMQKFYDGETR